MRLGWLRISCISPKTARATTRQPQHSESGTGSQSTAPRARRRTQVSTRATFVHDLASRGPSINASSKSAGRGPADTQDRRARAHRRTQVSTRATFVHDLARRGQSINASSKSAGRSPADTEDLHKRAHRRTMSWEWLERSGYSMRTAHSQHSRQHL